MSLEWMENFSQYGTDETKMVDGLWAERDQATLENDPDGVSSGKVMYFTDVSNEASIRRVLSAAQTTVGVAFRAWFPALPVDGTNSPLLLRFLDVASAVQVSIEVGATGIISAYRGEATTLLGASAAPAITAAAWHHIEVKVLFSQTVGTVEVRVNGVTKLTLTGQDTVASANVECSQLEFNNKRTATPDNTPWYCKDVVVWNGAGSQNNNFVGDVQVVTLLPTSDASLNWTPSSGATGFNLIDETTPDDTDYISAPSTPPAAYQANLGDLGASVVTVIGLETVVRALKTDAGTATMQVGLISNADTDEGAANPITTAATYWFDISELDPQGGAAWTPTRVNAAKLKINRTA